QSTAAWLRCRNSIRRHETSTPSRQEKTDPVFGKRPGYAPVQAIRISARSRLRLRHDADVRAWCLPAERVGHPGLLVGHRAGDDHVVTLLPLRRCRDLVLRRQLQGIDDTQDLVEVPAGGHWIGEDQLDLLVGTDRED